MDIWLDKLPSLICISFQYLICEIIINLIVRLINFFSSMLKWMMKKWIQKLDWSLLKLLGFLNSTACLPPQLMLFLSFVTKSPDSMISASRTENYFSDLHVWSFLPWGYRTGFTTFSNSCFVIWNSYPLGLCQIAWS